MAKERHIKRRQFLAGALSAGPALGLAAKSALAAEEMPAKPAVPAKPNTVGDTQPPMVTPGVTVGRTGSDFMVDALRALDIEYVASCPGSTFRGLQESIINYGMNAKPEFITCIHEEASVAMAHGYSKIAGKPMSAMVHGVVGLQHASMAIYNAWCDQAPVVVMAGNVAAGTARRPGVEWAHSSHDQASMVRDYTKWDDQAENLQDFSEGLVRAYDIATTVPMGPTVVIIDADQQEEELDEAAQQRLFIPKKRSRTQPAGDPNAVREAAKLLAAAEYPVVVSGRYARTEEGPKRLVAFVELLKCAVVDEHNRMNLPNRHPYNHSSRGGAALRQADVVLMLEPLDLYGSLNSISDIIGRPGESKILPGTKVIVIGTTDMSIGANIASYERYSSADLSITGDAEATMPMLIEALGREMTPARTAAAATRGQKLADISAKFLQAAHAEAAYGWDSSPISTARLCAEVWDQIKDEEYTMASEVNFLSNWPYRLWDMKMPYNTMGGSVGAGVGYNAPAAVGAALANKPLGRITVALNGDGDLMMSPGCLWTAAHHQIPLLMMVHNNRAWHQEYMHVERIAARHMRGIDRCSIGTTMREPNIDFAGMAKSMGVYGQMVENPHDLGPAIKNALALVRKGEPALVEVVAQPR